MFDPLEAKPNDSQPTPFRDPLLMSPMTQRYVEALCRDGDDFHYDTWLRTVREEQAAAKATQPLKTFASGEVPTAEIGNRFWTSDNRGGRPHSAPTPITRMVPMPRAIRPATLKRIAKTPRARLRRWLGKVADACDDFQASRARDAVYAYLAAVFAIVVHYKVRRRTNKLVRYAFQFADLPFDKNADLFTAVIRCTRNDNVDDKTVSKWARALRYAAYRKTPPRLLQAFIKALGGVNACASRHARVLVRRRRQQDHQ